MLTDSDGRLKAQLLHWVTLRTWIQVMIDHMLRTFLPLMKLKILFKENFLEEELFQQTGYKPEQEPFSLERSDSEVSQRQCFVMHQR